jgi:hypothetical protein
LRLYFGGFCEASFLVLVRYHPARRHLRFTFVRCGPNVQSDPRRFHSPAYQDAKHFVPYFGK